jgi:hypothetical protein
LKAVKNATVKPIHKISLFINFGKLDVFPRPVFCCQQPTVNTTDHEHNHQHDHKCHRQHNQTTITNKPTNTKLFISSCKNNLRSKLSQTSVWRSDLILAEKPWKWEGWLGGLWRGLKRESQKPSAMSGLTEAFLRVQVCLRLDLGYTSLNPSLTWFDIFLPKFGPKFDQVTSIKSDLLSLLTKEHLSPNLGQTRPNQS